MGQKTHPIGIRLGINRESCSRWYAKRANYAFFINEDHYLRKYIFLSFSTCLISYIEIERCGRGLRLRILRSNIMPIVGVKGASLEKLCYKVRVQCIRYRNTHFHLFPFKNAHNSTTTLPEVQVLVRQLKSPGTKARCLSDFMVAELNKRTPFRRILSITHERVKNIASVLGLRIQISGRLNGIEIARTEWIRKGRVPLHSLSANLDYHSTGAPTIYGLLGVKVWVFSSKEVI
jgi:small subunit ribosomal protein S3